MTVKQAADEGPTFGEGELDQLQHDTFRYFWEEADPRTGLLADNTVGDAPASIAANGLALAAYVQ